MHEAVTDPAPGCGVPIEQFVPAGHPAVVLPAVTEAGCEELQVNGGFGTTQPWTSTAVAIAVWADPLLTAKLV